MSELLDPAAPALEHASTRFRFAPGLTSAALLLSLGCEAQLGGPGSSALLDQPGDGGVVPIGDGDGVGDGDDGPNPGSGGSTVIPDVLEGVDCDAQPIIAAAPLRRLTRFEYQKTVEDVLGDESGAGNTLPSELLGNGFGNDAEQQPISSFLAEQYASIAEDVAAVAIANAEFMARYAPCAATVAAAEEVGCARSFVEAFAPHAFRHPLETEDVDELVELFQLVRGFGDFSLSMAALVEGIMLSPDFLYRLEFGEVGADGVRRPNDFEMATRLSYLFLGSSPDEALIDAAEAGALSTAPEVHAQATRLLGEDRTRETFRFFFDHFLPISNLTDLARDPAQYPTFSSRIGSLMRQETQAFLEHVIFEGAGDYKTALTAPYTFVNEELAAFYGMDPVTGEHFREAPTDPATRMGFLTHGSVLTGTTVSNFTNPVRRGAFLLHGMMCLDLPQPPPALAAEIKPPDPYVGATGRERYAAHSEQQACANCHALMDPPGFALENYDAVGLWRDQENGVTIDASGQITVLPESFSGPMELITLLSESETTYACFSQKWLNYAFGRTLRETDLTDACLRESVMTQFVESGYDVQGLLLALTQTDSFLRLAPLETAQ